jgi:hypothetical protein
VVRSVRPQKGYLYFFGGTKIRVTGTNFEETEQLACVFDNTLDGRTSRHVTFVSSTELECLVSAPSDYGEVSVRVSLNGIYVSHSQAYFVLLPRAIVTSMTPESGSMYLGRI